MTHFIMSSIRHEFNIEKSGSNGNASETVGEKCLVRISAGNQISYAMKAYGGVDV
jgi:hypothetical protein